MQFRFQKLSSLVLSSFVVLAACGGSSPDYFRSDLPPAPPGEVSSVGDLGSSGDRASLGEAPRDDMEFSSDPAWPPYDGPSPKTLSLIAGGLGGDGTMDGPRDVARVTIPYGMALDHEGNLYFTDGNRIRKVHLASGEVTTLAGAIAKTGSDDGTGSDARFNYPRGLAYGLTADGKKNLYVADYGNGTIRVVNTATAEVTTLAGTAHAAPNPGETGDGIGTSARFVRPSGLTLDGKGNLYIADRDNNTIRQLDISTGKVTTLAGSTKEYGGNADCTSNCTASDSLFNLPEDVAYGVTNRGEEVLYVADGDETIRQVFIADHRVITLTKDDQVIQLEFLPSGIVPDGMGHLLLSGGYERTIERLDLATGEVTILAGVEDQQGSSDGTGSGATFGWTNMVAYDGVGNLYVGDTSSTIRRVVVAGTDTGKVTTIAGVPEQFGSNDGTGDAARFYGPAAVTHDGKGNLYVADGYNDTIRKVEMASGEVLTLAGQAGIGFGYIDDVGDKARFAGPRGVAYDTTLDGKGHLFVADYYNRAIRRVDLDTASVTTLVRIDWKCGTGAPADPVRFCGGPQAIVSDGQGYLYMAADEAIWKVEIATKAVSTVVSTDAGIRYPNGLALDGKGNLYAIEEFSGTRILKVNLATKAVSVFTGHDATGADAVFMAGGLTSDGAGHLYVTDVNHVVRKVDLATGLVSRFAGDAGAMGVTPGPLPAVLSRPTAVSALSPSDVIIIDENCVLRAY